MRTEEAMRIEAERRSDVYDYPVIQIIVVEFIG